MSYVVLMYVLAFRLGWLRRTKRAPDAPATIDFLWKGFGYGAVAFLFTGRHRTFGDPITTALVTINRILLPIGAVMIAVYAVGIVIATHGHT